MDVGARQQENGVTGTFARAKEEGGYETRR
jgi:hypothetical protein